MGKRIAITGGIGSGKSSVLQYLQSVGYPVFSCDEIYKDVIIDPLYIEKLSNIFPSAIHNGAIDRKILSDIIFSNPDARAQLNSIAHPIIMKRLYAEMDKSKAKLVFAEVPLLFEGGYEQDFDGIIIIQREENSCINDVIKRDCVSKNEALRRISAQEKFHAWFQSYKNRENVWIIDNNANITILQKKIQKWVESNQLS